METLLAAVVLLLVIVVPIYIGYRLVRSILNRGKELNTLAQHGITVTGYIKKLERIIRSRAGTDELYLTYQFQDGSGQEHIKRLRVLSSQYKACSQGDPLEVVYLRDRPQINATLDMVEKMRAGLAKHQGSPS